MSRYNPLEIEKKWQENWAKNPIKTSNKKGEKPTFYIAEMFPYPSGAGLHVGHVRNFTIVDALARFYKQQGFEVLRPFGYDTFGLPTENYAIKTGVSPEVATKNNIESFRKQLLRLGYLIEWEREIETSSPEYYKWTQWLFLELFKKGLAYQKESAQWWCPVDKTVLANEQVEGGKCWRCGTEVEKKSMKQWFFKITDYAEELLSGIDELDWPEKIKIMQKNWIGKSVGAEIDFEVLDFGKKSIKVFTTRPDTLFGATYLVLAPEHKIVEEFCKELEKEKDAQVEKIWQYKEESSKKSEIERQENKEKTGVFTGFYAKNPVTGEKMPIWISDYVLAEYGEGAIMAVPAHDNRDYAFAKKFDLPIREVIERPEDAKEEFYTGEGKLINSDRFNGLESAEAREQIVEWLEKQGIGKTKTTYRMHDWLISRQRYWGCPIPIVYNEENEPVAVNDLPVYLPEVEDYKPDESGRSALAKATDWLEVEVDGKKMTRETDTLDGYACSSWYLWRYVSPRFSEAAWDQEAIKKWGALDVYVGGDHAVAHLLYIRFWCKFFADLGLLPFREPIKKLLYNGYINAPDGKKMSKSKGNVIDPLEVIEQGYGADTLRVYELFIGPYDEDAAWDVRAIGGIYRFLNRVFNLSEGELATDNLKERTKARHQAIKKVTIDMKRNGFNTAIAGLMEYVNELYKIGAEKEDLVVLGKLLKPFAPHLASEILEKFKADDGWPVWEEKWLEQGEVEVVVQINGKLRAKMLIEAEIAKDGKKLEALALNNEKIRAGIDKKEVKKVIVVVKNRLVNIVV